MATQREKKGFSAMDEQAEKIQHGGQGSSSSIEHGNPAEPQGKDEDLGRTLNQ